MTPSTPAPKCKADFYALWCDNCNLHPVNCPLRSTPAPTDAGALANLELAERIEKAIVVSLMQQPDDPGPLWAMPLPYFEQARIVAALRSCAPQETRGGWPPPFEPMKLQARKPDGGEWTDIFPAQLQAMVRNGCDVRAIESQQETRGDEPTDEWCNAFLKSMGQWVEPHEPEKECGVAIECGITQEDADSINAEFRAAVREALTDAGSLAAPQQSPRLEREGTISECVKAVEALKIRHAGKDAGNGYRFNAAMDEAVNAILALLSLDTASAASSTERCECIGGSTYNDGTQRRCDLCGKPVPSVSSKNRGAE